MKREVAPHVLCFGARVFRHIEGLASVMTQRGYFKGVSWLLGGRASLYLVDSTEKHAQRLCIFGRSLPLRGVGVRIENRGVPRFVAKRI